ncbi:MAG: hypothetical protein KAW45_06515 [Thermoplasmatales archaeon]|nr:hypothetical protein [Thermoplasmatales archaeon]
MHKKFRKQLLINLKYNKVSSIGIGSMIVFIAMILVAGIAAAVLIQTSSQLEAQAIKSGRDTKNEVSSDIDVLKVTGQYGTREINGVNYSRFHNMTIMVTPRGASIINLNNCVVQISDGTDLLMLSYNNTFATTPTSNGVFSTAAVFNLNASEFGIIAVEDHDGSISASAPSINHGDKALITVNLSACYNGLAARTDIKGMVVPEHGSPGIFLFRTPTITTRTIVTFL